ncbi:ribosome biogenesis GTPase YlqF [Cyanosarcina cf. burmensis CCALA 770]|nr:ribosome biogenesis GTPase YlqF [Cyanosarcina cf. burmensis CCALA 770]
MTNDIQWYPGHIAKAERALAEQLKLVDVVLEVRDARIPLATHHPRVPEWVGNKTRVLILNRVDAIPPAVRQLWQQWFKTRGETVYFTNAKDGNGVGQVLQVAQRAGDEINQRRKNRGLLARPVRAAAIGFPNVGKSALINRLLKRRIVVSEARPGVTRQLRWVRISDRVELLDAPGVIPTKLEDQAAAIKLAICDDIGDAAYDSYQVAVIFIDLLQDLMATAPELMPDNPLSRYKIDSLGMTGEEFVYELSAKRDRGDLERTARQILIDFRKGILGTVPLELPLN